MKIDLLPGEALALRTCTKDMASHHDAKFIWPREGEVVAPDWNSQKECGGGLHGLLYGEGDSGNIPQGESNVWVLFAVDVSKWVEIDGKGKAERGRVIYAGEKQGAIDLLCATHPGKCINWGTATAGNWGTATAGNWGTATAGEGGTLIWKIWNGSRYRFTIGYIGEDGLKADTAYELVEGKITEKVKP